MKDNEFKLIFIPQLGVNDSKVKIIKWFIKEGMHINCGDLICSVESTKTAYDVESEYEGIFSLFFNEGDEVDITEPVAVVFKNKEMYDKLNVEFSTKFKKSKTQSQIATQKAVKKAKELGIDISMITKKGIIKEKDVVEYFSSQNVTKMDLSTLYINKNKNNIVIYGSGKGAVTIYETLSFDKYNKVICFLDDDNSKQGILNNIPVISSEYFFNNFKYLSEIKVACEIANSNFRLNLYKRLEKMGIELINVIHPDTYISPSVKIGKGNFIKAGAIIETNSSIGNCCIIDNSVIIPHDNKIGDGCHLAPGVVLGSSIEIGKNTVVGIGASISTKISIGKNVIIGVGSSVVTNIPDNSIVEGVPGKIIGKRK